MMQNPILEALSTAGVSVWLDDLSRDRLTSGNLQQLIDTRSVGMTGITMPKPIVSISTVRKMNASACLPGPRILFRRFAFERVCVRLRGGELRTRARDQGK